MSEAAPALTQDQPTALDSTLEAFGVPRSLSAELLQFARRADLRLDGEGADEGIDAPEAPETDQPPEGEEEFSIDSFDPTQVPEDADREWFAERVQKLRADYTKKTQSLAEERREAEQAQQIITALRNPQVAPAILAQFGYDERKMLELYGYQTDEEPDEAPDLYDEVEGLKQTLAQQQEAAQRAQYEAQVEDHIAGEIEALEKKEKREFDAEEHQLLDVYARANPKPDGTPNVEGAFNLLSGIVKSRFEARLKPKQQTPRPPGGGKPGSRQVDLSKESREGRLERMAEAVNETSGSVAA